ncbi:MAG: hypothetical protein AABX70_01480 [Nanoarchaeota archaeon]
MSWRERKQDNRKRIWVSVFMAALMIFSAFGVYLGSVSSGGDSFEYKDYKFKLTDGKYVVKLNNKEIPFYSLPQDVESLNVSKESVELIRRAWIPQVVFDPAQESLQYIELTRFDWNRWWGKPLVNGVTSASNVYPDLPVLSCANATQNSPVIYLNSSFLVSSQLKGNCLILNGLGVDFLRWRDRILYTYFGVLG